MKTRGIHTASMEWSNPLRRLMLLATLLAFFLQTFAVQTHIHTYDEDPATPQAMPLAPPEPANALDYADGSCRLCQQLAQAAGTMGVAIVSPLAIISFIVTLRSFAELPVTVLPHRHPWHSRGPPR